MARHSSAWRACGRSRFFISDAVKPGQPVDGEIDHRGLALRREIAAERAGDVDQAKLVPETLARIAAVCVSVDFCKTRSSLSRPKGLPISSKRNVVVAAERQAAERVDLLMAEVRIEFEPAGGDDVGRHGDDRGAGIDGAPGRLHRDPASGVDRTLPALPAESLRPWPSVASERAKTLLAERRRIALGERAQNRGLDTCARSLAQV